MYAKIVLELKDMSFIMNSFIFMRRNHFIIKDI